MKFSPVRGASFNSGFSLSFKSFKSVKSELHHLKMASQATICSRGSATTLSFRHAFDKRDSFQFNNISFQRPRFSFSVVASTKRNPKRLKYSTPRLNTEDKLLYVEADPSGSDSWKLEPVIELIKQGAVGIIPTDTVYTIVCDLKNQDAIERLRRMKNIDSSKPLSILCRSLHDIDTYTMGFPRGDGQGHTSIFRVVKHCLPGPCIWYGTPKARLAARKNVGVRIPDDPICQAILQKLDAPLISTSVKCPKENQWLLDPVIIADIYGPEGLDFIVDGGVRVANPSTVVDMTGHSPKIIRQGKGPKLDWMEDEDSVDYGDGLISTAV